MFILYLNQAVKAEPTLQKGKNMEGKIHAISISRRKGIPKSNISSANLIYEHGIENDVHAGKWHRQVSLLAVESIDKMRVKLPNLRAGAFAEKITTEGINLSKLTVGK